MMKSDDKLKRVHILLSQIFSWILLAFHYSHFSNILQSSILLRDQEEYTYVHEAAGWQQKNNKSRECPHCPSGPGDHRYIDTGIESFALGPLHLSSTPTTSLSLSLSCLHWASCQAAWLASPVLWAGERHREMMSRERKKQAAAALQEKLKILRSITHSHAVIFSPLLNLLLGSIFISCSSNSFISQHALQNSGSITSALCFSLILA